MRAAISLMLVIPSTISMATIAILLLTIMLQSSEAGKILYTFPKTYVTTKIHEC